MAGKRIKVTAYAGYRDEEAPRAFEHDGTGIEVIGYLGRWTEEESGTRRRWRCFKVRGSDLKAHTICYDEAAREWLHRE